MDREEGLEWEGRDSQIHHAGEPVPLTGKPERPPALRVDWAEYESYLEGSGLTEQEKRAFLEALWAIIVSFVDLGFGIHPLQHVCGQDSEFASSWTSAFADPLTSDRTGPNNNNMKAAGGDEAAPAGENES